MSFGDKNQITSKEIHRMDFLGRKNPFFSRGVAAKMFPENRHTIKGTCYGCYAVPGGNKKRVNSWKLKVEVLGVYCSSRDFPSLKLTART